MKIIIIGGGPGGYETALEAAKKGVETVLISAGPLGGTCLNEGCIPTKTLCHFAETADGGPDGKKSDEFMSSVQARKAEVVAQLQNGIKSLLGNKLITVVEGTAELVDGRTVRVGEETYCGDAIIIATGSVSARLPIPGAGLPEVLSSREILGLQTVPERLCVIGGGVIGLEFASIFNSFGSEDSVVEYTANLRPHFDLELSKRLKKALSKKGISIEVGAGVTEIEKLDGGVSVKYSKKGKEMEIEADLVLMAVGRKANPSLAGLEKAGVELGPRGIVVDSNMQTSVPGIYAVGDVTGGIMLAHVASFQGRRALSHILGERDNIDFSIVPAAVFTVPEVATVGMTEEDCKAQGIKIKTLKAFYRANGKAVSMGQEDGYCKFIVSDGPADALAEGKAALRDGQILGCHIMGAHASDLIHEAAVLMNFGATVEQAKAVIHAHPSLSEILQNALSS